MLCKLARLWPAVMAAALALAPPAAAALRARLPAEIQQSSSLRWSSALLAAKEPEPTPDEAGLFGPPFKVPLLRVDTGDVVTDVQMQLAITPPEQHHGLMFRRSLAEDSGMLFLYTRPSRRVLWMKNTYVPLDAAWFTSDGVLREVQHLLPLDLTYRWSDREDISMGLETPEGYFQKHGFTPGSLKLDLAVWSILPSRARSGGLLRAMENWQGTSFTQQEFFQQQEQIPVEISPEEPNLAPLQHFSTVAGIHPALARNISAAGYQLPTPVQKWGIPLLLLGRDVMACAQTGSGKTAFYLFPPINDLLCKGEGRQESPPSPPVLVLGPTRELCVQIFEEAQRFAQGTRVKPAVVYGGTDYKESFRQLRGGVDLLVATPGRLQDLCEKHQCSLRWIQCLVLDEADRMLDMGFEPQIRQIVQKLGMPKSRQTVMTSATFPVEVQHLAQEFMRDYSFMAVGRVGGTASTIQQKLLWVDDTEKDAFMFGLLMRQPSLGLFLIFVNTKQQASDLERFLHGCGFNVQSIHGDRTQQQREVALEAFKSGASPVLIATDVAARGLDIPDVAVVVQYDLAMSVDDYVHRVGRTGRIGKKGLSIGLMNARNRGVSADLCAVLEDSGVQLPPFLVGMALSTGNYQPGAGENGQAQYGGQDVRRSMRKGFQTLEEREKAKRYAGFAKDAYGQGSAEQAQEAAASVGPAMPGSYQGAANRGSGKGKKGRGKGKAAGGKNAGGWY